MTDANSNPERRLRTREILRFENESFTRVNDKLATEEPLEIRVVFGPGENRKNRSLSITMRTPGHDEELAAGFLRGEGIISQAKDILKFERTGPRDETSGETNQLCVHLAEHLAFDFGSLQRNFYTTSSCGICGKASLEAVRAHLGDPIASDDTRIAASTIKSLPGLLRNHQQTFEETGGLHAAGLFDNQGSFISGREDVGRHNALDKLIGARLLGKEPYAKQRIVLVSGRASFELVQKVVAAGIPMLVAVGAPSSLAAELADELGVTLVGFASSRRFNVYCHPFRVASDENADPK